ncbi:MAG: hypothetical protein GQ474_07835 [Sulfurimonas sp.]|nr:hypothetical protein [Sulfurimonas sp.]
MALVPVTTSSAPLVSPISTQEELDAHLADLANPHVVTKTQLVIENVDNTSDADKPVSTAQQTALDLKADLASPTFTGTVVVPTAGGATSPYQKGEVDTALATKQGTLTNSAGLLAALSDETGTGLSVFNASPTLTTPTVATLESAAADTPTVFEDNGGTEVGQLCTAWIKYDGITPVEEDAFNLSIAQTALGKFTGTFDTNMANANYAVVSISSHDGTNGGAVESLNTFTRTTSGFLMESKFGSAANHQLVDRANMDIAVFGGK